MYYIMCLHFDDLSPEDNNAVIKISKIIKLCQRNLLMKILRRKISIKTDFTPLTLMVDKQKAENEDIFFQEKKFFHVS